MEQKAYRAEVLSAAQIADSVRGLAQRLDEAYAESQDLVLVGVLRGAVYFLADLSRAMATRHRLDFVEMSSYSGRQRGNGRLGKICTDPCRGADVVLVDEVFDSGETISRLRAELLAEEPKSLVTCVLLWKEGLSDQPPPELYGFAVGPEFLVGYGLDFDQQLRHLPYVGILD